MSTPDIYSLSKSAFTDTPHAFDDFKSIYLIDDIMAVTAVVLGRRPNTVILKRLGAIDRCVQSIVLYPLNSHLWVRLADTLDSLTGLLESSGPGDVTREMHRLSAEARHVISGLEILPNRHVS